MNTQLSIIAAAMLAMSVSASAGAASIVEWDLTGATGSQSFTATASAAANITGLDLLRGAGLSGSTGSNSINASGWTGQATDYFSFGFTVAAGHEADLTSLVIGTRASSTGPGSLGLFYSGDAYTSALYTFNQAPGGNYVNSIVDLGALNNLTGTVEFRVAQIGTTSAGGGTTGSSGTFRIAEYYDGATYTNLQINGAVAMPVPEADTYALMLAGVALLGLRIRRRKVSLKR